MMAPEELCRSGLVRRPNTICWPELCNDVGNYLKSISISIHIHNIIGQVEIMLIPTLAHALLLESSMNFW